MNTVIVRIAAAHMRLLLIAAVIGIAVAWLLSKCHAGSFVCVRFIVTEKAEQIINVQLEHHTSNACLFVYFRSNVCTTFRESSMENRSVTSTVMVDSSFNTYPRVTFPVAPGWISAVYEFMSYPVGWSR